jgi:hypothetical protein
MRLTCSRRWRSIGPKQFSNYRSNPPTRTPGGAGSWEQARDRGPVTSVSSPVDTPLAVDYGSDVIPIAAWIPNFVPELPNGEDIPLEQNTMPIAL